MIYSILETTWGSLFEDVEDYWGSLFNAFRVFEDVRKGYQQLAKDRREVEILDASKPIELISQQTKTLVERLF